MTTSIVFSLKHAGALLGLSVLAGMPITVPANAGSPAIASSHAVRKLHVDGRFLTDQNGNHVNLHGWYQPAQSYFNGGGGNYPDPTDYTNAGNVAPALHYLEAMADFLSDRSPKFGTDHGWCTNFVRINGSPGQFAPGWDKATGELTDNAQFMGWIKNLLVPYVNHCRQRGLYVVIMGLPSEVFPGGVQNNNMTAQYQRNLIKFWTVLANYPGLKSVNNVHFEICNEPINIESSFGAGDWAGDKDPQFAAITKYFQPVVDAIRATKADNIIWVPGLGWQSQYSGYVKYPLHGSNLGYAGHIYPQYGGAKDDAAKVVSFWDNHYKPIADLHPFMITELWWQKHTAEEIKADPYSELFSGSTGDEHQGFGTAIKRAFDKEGNVSYLIGFAGDLIGNLKNVGTTADFSKATLPDTDGAQAAFKWFAEYARAEKSTPAAKHGKNKRS